MMIRAARLERETDDHGDDYEDGDGDDDGVALEQKTADKEFKFPNGRLALENNRKNYYKKLTMPSCNNIIELLKIILIY